MNQIVLTISDLSIKMLCDYMTQASAVRCKPNCYRPCRQCFLSENSLPASLAAASHKSNAALAADLLEVLSTVSVEFKASESGDPKFKVDAKQEVLSSDGISAIIFKIKRSQRLHVR